MRKKLVLAATAVALAASFGPVGTASAVCYGWYYDLTGQCSPCDPTAYAINRVSAELGGNEIAHCPD